jgi:hypothetical protein
MDRELARTEPPESNPSLEILGEAEELEFDLEGNLAGLREAGKG